MLPPRITPDGAWANPTQQLDYRRFASDLLLEEFVAERDLLHRLSPGVPVTTNFMVMTRFNQLDYWAWAREMDVVSNDYYPDFADPLTHVEAAMSADVVRGLAEGGPWLLMETSPSAVNWQPRNPAKRPGQLRRDALQQVAHGADGVQRLPGRAPRSPARRSSTPACIPHAGTDTRLWREVVELGATLDRLAEVAGSRVEASVAMVWDWQAWWGVELDSHPSRRRAPTPTARARSTARCGTSASPSTSSPRAPRSRATPSWSSRRSTSSTTTSPRSSTPTSAAAATSWSRTSRASSTSTTTSVPAATPAPSASCSACFVEEFAPLLAGDRVTLDDGGSADVWTEDLRLDGAEAVVRYVDGPVPGRPAVTRHDARRRGRVVRRHPHRRRDDRPGSSSASSPTPVSRRSRRRRRASRSQRRRNGDASWLFVLNHTDDAATVAAHGTDIVSGVPVSGSVTLPAGGVAVVREGGGA